VDCLKIINTCLTAYGKGDSHMFKPIAAQLRMLYCDKNKGRDNSLLTRLSPDIELLAFEPIAFAPAISGGTSWQLARAPYFVSVDDKGVHEAEIRIGKPLRYLPISEWLLQEIDLAPIRMTVKKTILAVADKGGGAHVDSKEGEDLSALKENRPRDVGANVFFIVALAKYTLRAGNQFTWDVVDRGLLKNF